MVISACWAVLRLEKSPKNLIMDEIIRVNVAKWRKKKNNKKSAKRDNDFEKKKSFVSLRQ